MNSREENEMGDGDTEGIDDAGVSSWFASHVANARPPLRYELIAGGHSNLTYLLTSADERWVLRRPPFGSKVKSAHDMSREYRILSALKDVYSYGPVPIHFCGDHSVIGCDFYLMNYIQGLVIRREYPTNLNLSPDQIRTQLLNFFDVLGDLHSVDLVEAGLDTFGKPVGYVRRQVEGWSRRWVDAVTPDTVSCDNTIQWLNDNMPKESGKYSVIHNDYKPVSYTHLTLPTNREV